MNKMRQTITYYLLFYFILFYLFIFHTVFLFLLVACLLCLLQEYNTCHSINKFLKEHKHILHMSKNKAEGVSRALFLFFGHSAFSYLAIALVLLHSNKILFSCPQYFGQLNRTNDI